MHIVGFGVYTSSYAGTRLRFSQYIPEFESRGHIVQFVSFIPNWMERCWASDSLLVRTLVFLLCMARISIFVLLGMIRPPDIVLVRKEIVPIGTAIAEQLLSLRSVIVWDVDDAVWEKRPSRMAPLLPPILRRNPRKYAEIARLSKLVLAGSQGTANWVLPHNPNVQIAPTPVAGSDDHHIPQERQACWIGSPATTRYLGSLLNQGFGACLRRNGMKVVAVGAEGHQLSAWSDVVEVRPWSLANERAALASSSIGLYPVFDDEDYANAKAGLKAILYIANGLPQITSDTRVNRCILGNSAAGMLCGNTQEFCATLDACVTDPEWLSKARAAAKNLAPKYSPEVWGNRIASWLEHAFQETRSPG